MSRPLSTAAAAPPSRNPLVRFQRGFETCFGKVREGYRDLLVHGPGDRPRLHHRLHGGGGGLLRPGSRTWARNFFPSVDAGQITLHVRAPVGARLDDTSRAVRPDRPSPIRKVVPPDEARVGGRQHRHPRRHRSTMVYSQLQPDLGPQDGDVFVSPEARHTRGRRLREAPARGAALPVPQRDLLVPAGRHRQPDPELRRAVPDRPPDRRSRTPPPPTTPTPAKILRPSGGQSTAWSTCACSGRGLSAGSALGRRPFARMAQLGH